MWARAPCREPLALTQHRRAVSFGPRESLPGPVAPRSRSLHTRRAGLASEVLTQRCPNLPRGYSVGGCCVGRKEALGALQERGAFGAGELSELERSALGAGHVHKGDLEAVQGPARGHGGASRAVAASPCCYRMRCRWHGAGCPLMTQVLAPRPRFLPVPLPAGHPAVVLGPERVLPRTS